MHVSLPTPERPRATFEIGQSVDGTPIICHRLGSKQPGAALFIASIHGSEGAGTPLLEAYLDQWGTHDGAPPVLVVPIANPDGLATSKRLNRRRVDLNRNFPADNREDKRRYGEEALSEPESLALYELIQREQPRLIVSIHQPVACVDYDGPPETEMLAEAMAEACRLPVKKLGSRPGSLGAYFGETLKRPIITFELPPLASTDPATLWKRYGEALRVAARF